VLNISTLIQIYILNVICFIKCILFKNIINIVVLLYFLLFFLYLWRTHILVEFLNNKYQLTVNF